MTAEKATYEAYALARSSRDCQRGQHDDCDGVAYDPDEHHIIPCLCGCRIANDTDVSNPPTSPVGANLASLEGNGAAGDIDRAFMADKPIGFLEIHGKAVTATDATIIKAAYKAFAEQVEQAKAEHRHEWADYFENWAGVLGLEPLTVEKVAKVLRWETVPFGFSDNDEKAKP